MGYTVEAFLQTKEIENVKILCGEAGISNKIKGVTIIEAPDIVRFIGGGELLLTGLYAFRGCNIEEFQSYISEFENKEIAGIVIKQGRKVDNADVKINILRKFSEENKVPLIEVPFEISFQKVLSVVMGHLFDDEVTKLKYFKTTHDNFTALSLSNSKSKNPIGGILDMLNKLIHNPIALYNHNMSCYATTDEELSTFKLSKDAKVYSPRIISNYRYWKQEDDYSRYVVEIKLNVGVKMYLVITEKYREFSYMDEIAIENAIVALQYEFSRQFAVLELEKKFKNDILHNILNGRLSSGAELRKNATLIGIDWEANYRVLVFGTVKCGVENKKVDEQKLQMEALEDILQQEFSELKLHRELEKIIAIKEVNSEQTQVEFRIEMKEMLKNVQTQMTRQFKKSRVKLGVGRIAEGVVHLQDSYKEAIDAFDFLEMSLDVSDEMNQPIMLFSDLGIFKLLCQLDDPKLLMEYVPESLQKLYNYKKPQRDDLIITLKAYLDYNQNLSKTAQELYIHYKTAAYRIEKITKLTGMDFNNANEMLAVRIGLVVYKMIERNEKID